MLLTNKNKREEQTLPQSAAGAISVSLAVETAKRIVPSGLAWARTRLSGKQILVLGDRRAGKSNFVDYLRFGILDEERPTKKTHDVQSTPTFGILLGPDSRLEVRVRSVTEIPGQYPPLIQAHLVRERRPHALVILLDLSQRSCRKWLDAFAEHLNVELLRSGAARARKRLQVLLVAMNKADKVTTAAMKTRQAQFRKVLVSRLPESLGYKPEAVPIIPSILVSTRDGNRLAEQLVTTLARELMRGH